MKKIEFSIILLLLLCFTFKTFSQGTKCDCEAFLNIESVDFKDLSTKNFYKTIQKYYLDENECVNFKIIADSSDYFKLWDYESVTNKKFNTIWLKKTEQFGTMDHDGESSVLVLHEFPDYKSKIIKYLKVGYLRSHPNPPKISLTVINCNKKWIKVKVKVGNKIYEGWLRPGGHCPNSCTNCC